MDALEGKGVALYHLKRLEDSISTYNKALEIDPNYFSGRDDSKV